MGKKFSTGNIVQLKSSPKHLMTVRKYDTDAPDLLLCEWHDEKGEPQSNWYTEPMLALVGE